MKYEIYRFGKIDSTNSYLLRLGDEGFPEGTIAVADEQTGGRGRFGRRWEAEPLSSLLLSILLRPGFLKMDEVFVLTFSAAVAVADAVERVAGVRAQLKWPNDILLNGKKVCGILLESNFEGGNLNFVVLGIGLNVNQSAFSEGIRDKATSLSLVTGRKFDREEVLATILSSFSSTYETVKSRDFYSIMKRWRERSNMFGKKIKLRLADKIFEGILNEVADDGAILVETSSGLQRFTAGEITISEIGTP